MQVNISGHQLDVTDALRDYVGEAEPSGAPFRQDHQCSGDHGGRETEAEDRSHLRIAGGEIVTNAEHEDMYAAIDLLIDKLDRQLIKHKEKYLERQQGVGAR